MLPLHHRTARAEPNATIARRKAKSMNPADQLRSTLAGGPVTALAPMQDVTDLPFWRLMAAYGGPDLYVTEYFRVREGSHLEKPILRSITENPTGRPALAQMIGSHIPSLVRTARELQQHPVAGIDLNLGCPAPVVYKNAPAEACSANRKKSMPSSAPCAKLSLSPSPSRPASALITRLCSTSCSQFSPDIIWTYLPSTAAPLLKDTVVRCITILLHAPSKPCPVPFWPMAMFTPRPRLSRC